MAEDIMDIISQNVINVNITKRDIDIIKDLNCNFSEYSDKMKKLGEERNLDIRVMHEDIFNSMHRI